MFDLPLLVAGGAFGSVLCAPTSPLAVTRLVQNAHICVSGEDHNTHLVLQRFPQDPWSSGPTCAKKLLEAVMVEGERVLNVYSS